MSERSLTSPDRPMRRGSQGPGAPLPPRRTPTFLPMAGRTSPRGAVFLVARARLRRHWAAVLVVGLVGALGAGGVLALAAGARRTDTAYDRLRTETRAFDGRAL